MGQTRGTYTRPRGSYRGRKREEGVQFVVSRLLMGAGSDKLTVLAGVERSLVWIRSCLEAERDGRAKLRTNTAKGQCPSKREAAVTARVISRRQQRCRSVIVLIILLSRRVSTLKEGGISPSISGKPKPLTGITVIAAPHQHR